MWGLNLHICIDGHSYSETSFDEKILYQREFALIVRAQVLTTIMIKKPQRWAQFLGGVQRYNMTDVNSPNGPMWEPFIPFLNLRFQLPMSPQFPYTSIRLVSDLPCKISTLRFCGSEASSLTTMSYRHLFLLSSPWLSVPWWPPRTLPASTSLQDRFQWVSWRSLSNLAGTHSTGPV